MNTVPEISESTEKVSKEEVSLRFASYAQKLDKIVCTDRRAQIENDFLVNFTALCRKQAMDRALETNQVIDSFSGKHMSAVSGYHQTGSIEKHMALVVNAFDMTYHKDRPRAVVAPKKELEKVFTHENGDAYIRSVTLLATEFFEIEEFFCQMVGNKKSDNLVSVMSTFAATLPAVQKKKAKEGSVVHTMNHEKPAGFLSLFQSLNIL